VTKGDDNWAAVPMPGRYLSLLTNWAGRCDAVGNLSHAPLMSGGGGIRWRIIFSDQIKEAGGLVHPCCGLSQCAPVEVSERWDRRVLVRNERVNCNFKRQAFNEPRHRRLNSLGRAPIYHGGLYGSVFAWPGQMALFVLRGGWPMFEHDESSADDERWA